MKPGRPVGAPSEGGFSGSSNAVNPCRKRRFCLGVGGAEALFGAGPRTTSPKHHSLIHRRKLGEIKTKRKRYLKVSFFFAISIVGPISVRFRGADTQGWSALFQAAPPRPGWSGPVEVGEASFPIPRLAVPKLRSSTASLVDGTQRVGP